MLLLELNFWLFYMYCFEFVNYLLYVLILFLKDFNWKFICENELMYMSEWLFNLIIIFIIIKYCYVEINIYK